MAEQQKSVYVAYKGTSTLSLPAPGHGCSYVFEPMPVRNKLPESAWAELSDEANGGSAVPYLRGRVMRMTSRGDGFDKVTSARTIPIVKGQLPQVSAVDTSKDALIAGLQATVNRQNARLEALLKRAEADDAERSKKAEAPEPSKKSKADPGDEAADTDRSEIDPANYTAKSIKRVLAGLSLDELEAVKDREASGRNRDTVIKAIDAALDEALEREEQG